MSGNVETDENIFCTDGIAHRVDRNSRVPYFADAASVRTDRFNIFANSAEKLQCNTDNKS